MARHLDGGHLPVCRATLVLLLALACMPLHSTPLKIYIYDLPQWKNFSAVGDVRCGPVRASSKPLKGGTSDGAVLPFTGAGAATMG